MRVGSRTRLSLEISQKLSGSRIYLDSFLSTLNKQLTTTFNICQDVLKSVNLLHKRVLMILNHTPLYMPLQNLNNVMRRSED